MGRFRRGFGVAAFHSATAVVFTWPLAPHIASHLPLGLEDTPTVPFFNLWTLEWNAQRFSHWLRGYWDAPIFFPTKGAFARSEAQPLTGAVHAVLRPVFGATASYNLILLGFLVLNAVAVTVFARRVGAAWAPALLAGTVAQALPFTFAQLGVLQLVCSFPFVFATERLVTYRSNRRLRTLLGAGAWFVVCALTSGYYAIFLAILLAVVAPILLLGAVPIRRLLRDVAIVGVAAGLVLAPYLLSQKNLTDGDHWSTKTISNLSARPADYVDQNDDAITLPVLRADGNHNGIRETPGVYLTVLAVGGAVAGWRRRQRRIVTALVASAATMFVFSLGLQLSVFGWRPYRFLYDHVPGFERLRSPFRFSVGVQLSLVMLAVFALMVLWTWRAPGGRILAIGATALLVLEVVPFGAALTPVPDVANADWVRYLAQHRGGVVAMVPFPASGSARDFADTTVAMLGGLEHHHPIVNGYTGLFPKQFDGPLAEGGLWYAMDDFPSLCALEQLHRRDVEYVVAARDWYTPARAEATGSLGYREVFRGRDQVVLRDEQHFEVRDECT